MFGVLVGLLICVIVLTFSTAYIKQDTSSMMCKEVLTNTINDVTLTNKSSDYIFNCENMNTIKLLRVLGTGIDKVTHLGVYGEGTKVAVKMVANLTRTSPNGDRLKMLMKEILLFQELKHRNILKLLGFCIRGNKLGTDSLKEERAIAVYEYGEEVYRNRSFLTHLPLPQRLDTVLAIIDLFVYLERSPLGSLRLKDLQLRHFLWHDNTLKLIHLDGDWEEPSCQAKDNTRCEFNVTCVEGRCVGSNAKSNLLRISQVLLSLLLQNVNSLDLRQNKTRPDSIRQRALSDLKQLVSLLAEERNNQEVTSTWIRQHLLDARSVL